jgi:hypothetical protein
MSRSLLAAFVAVAFLVAPAALPNAIAPGLSGSAHAVTNLNSSRSNVYRTKKLKPPSKPPTEPMNGGGGATSGAGAGKTK